MKKILPLLVMVAMVASCKNEKKNDDGKSSSKDVGASGGTVTFYKNLYKYASNMEDPYTMIQAANGILSLDEKNNATYLDSLANIYTAMNMVGQAKKAAEKGLKYNAKNSNLLEIKINADAVAGDFEGALGNAKNLYKETKDIKYLYFQAQINMQAQRFDEARNVIDRLEQDPAFKTDSMKLQAPNGMQKVPLEAVALYMKGIIDLQERRPQLGISKMEKALNIFPPFYLCRRDLQQIMQRMQQGQQQGPPPQR